MLFLKLIVISEILGFSKYDFWSRWAKKQCIINKKETEGRQREERTKILKKMKDEKNFSIEMTEQKCNEDERTKIIVIIGECIYKE